MTNLTPIQVLRKRSRSKRGFTLIELLVVIAIILILAGITFGITRGVANAQARAKAKAELATISQAIEAFKLQYGDYPWHDADKGSYQTQGYSGTEPSTMLLYALTGRMKMSRDQNGDIQVELINVNLDNQEVVKNPSFLDVTKFTYTGSDNNPLALLDPWGYPYTYLYQQEGAAGSWEVFGYHLYSAGPGSSNSDNLIQGQINDTTGVLNPSFRDTANKNGIIFAGE